MFSGAFEDPDDDVRRSIVAAMIDDGLGSSLNPAAPWTIEVHQPSFYRGGAHLVRIDVGETSTLHGQLEAPFAEFPDKAFALFSPSAAIGFGSVFKPLDATNEPIYDFNVKSGNLVLSRSSAPDYLRFFFHFVRGQLGRFIIVEDVVDVPWTSMPPAASDLAAVGSQIKPIEYLGHVATDFYALKCTVLFKNALFSTYVLAAPYAATLPASSEAVQGHDTAFLGPNEEAFSIGQLALRNEDLLLEDLPIRQDQPADLAR